ncbi:hypothetical protein LLQ54_14635 [Rouxiella badensis]|uniref:hypothetical protein n=1 Tax=Rouxiella badensis TaxID=1646377 RepID=UPI001D14A32C|nr:hypothetical protein [Rouxiella badensis]MCC3741112.1 hypothetical protein [Rouxiella badensis]
MKTDTSRVPVFMLTQALAMGVTDGRQTPRPPETPTDDVHEPIARILRACPCSGLSDTSRPVVVCHQKHPNHGNGVCHYVRAGRPHCLSHGGNDSAERCVKTPRVKGGTPSPATRDHPL